MCPFGGPGTDSGEEDEMTRQEGKAEIVREII
jgi:hypothetical protein